ncbi:hypothetical protein, partial [Embleya sp. NPDC001921]
MLTASGSIIALTGMAITASALLGAARKLIRDFDIPPGEMAAAKLRQAKHASQAGMAAWQEAAGTRARRGCGPWLRSVRASGHCHRASRPNRATA